MKLHDVWSFDLAAKVFAIMLSSAAIDRLVDLQVPIFWAMDGWEHRAVQYEKSYGPTTLWLFNIAMGNGPFIDGLPIKDGDFPWLC